MCLKELVLEVFGVSVDVYGGWWNYKLCDEY